MQKFLVTLEVTVNTSESVSNSEVMAEMIDLVSDFDSGTIEVTQVLEQ